jgi:hypothetical protein
MLKRKRARDFYCDCGVGHDGCALHGSAGKLRLRNALPERPPQTLPGAELMQNLD